MTGVMAPFPAKYAVFEFVNTLQATFFSNLSGRCHVEEVLYSELTR